MRIYIIGNDGIKLSREAPVTVNQGEIAVASSEELHAAPDNRRARMPRKSYKNERRRQRKRFSPLTHRYRGQAPEHGNGPMVAIWHGHSRPQWPGPPTL